MGIKETQEQAWRAIVEFAFAGPTSERIEAEAEAASVSKSNLLRKVQAIQSFRYSGMDADSICRMGQREVLAVAQAEKRAQKGPQTRLAMVLPTDLADLFVAQQERLCREAGVHGWQAFVELLLGSLTEMTPAQIRHLAGCGASATAEKPR